MNSIKDLKKVRVTPEPEVWNKVSQRLRVHRFMRVAIPVAVVLVVAAGVLLFVPKHEVAIVAQNHVEQESAVIATLPNSESAIFPERVVDEKPMTVVVAQTTSNSESAQPKETQLAISQQAAKPSAVAVVAPVENSSLSLPQTNIASSSASTTISQSSVSQNAQMSAQVENEEAATPVKVSSLRTDTAKNAPLPVSVSETILSIPNVVLPNDDNENNRRFKVVANSQVTAYRLYIYNRGGRLVYQTRQITDIWDCTHNGTPVPQGTYVYVIQYSDKDGKPHYEKGSVSVIR